MKLTDLESAVLIRSIFERLPIAAFLGAKAKGQIEIGKIDFEKQDVQTFLLANEKALDKLIQFYNDKLIPYRKQLKRLRNQLPYSSSVKVQNHIKQKEHLLKGWSTVEQKRKEYLRLAGNEFRERPKRSVFEKELEEYKRVVIEYLLPNSLFQKSFPVIIPQPNRSRHTYILGSSGSGKTELLKLFIRYDILNPKHGVLVLDPHSDMTKECLQIKAPEDTFVYISAEFGREGIYPKYNPFEHQFHHSHPSEKQAFISMRAEELIQAFKKILATEFTPNMQRLIFHCMQVLLYNKGTKLQDFLDFLRPNRAEKYLSWSKEHPSSNTRDFFEYDFHQKTLAVTKQAIITRFENIFSNYHLEKIFDCTESSFNLKELLDQGKCVLVSLAQGIIGEMGTKLLGAFFVSEVTTHALQRQRVPISKRNPIFMVIDECQNFLSERIDKILSEGRKYGIHLILANQYLDQFGDKNKQLKESVLANSNIKLFGTVSSKDYARMCKETSYQSKNIPILKHGRFVLKVADFPAIIIKGHGHLIGTDSEFYLSKTELKERLIYQKQKYYLGDLPVSKRKNAETQTNVVSKNSTRKLPKINKLR